MSDPFRQFSKKFRITPRHCLANSKKLFVYSIEVKRIVFLFHNGVIRDCLDVITNYYLYAVIRLILLIAVTFCFRNSYTNHIQVANSLSNSILSSHTHIRFSIISYIKHFIANIISMYYSIPAAIMSYIKVVNKKCFVQHIQ